MVRVAVRSSVVLVLFLQPIIASAQKAQLEARLNDMPGEATRLLEAERALAGQDDTAEKTPGYPLFELYGGFVISAGGELAEPDDEKGTGALGWNASLTTNLHQRFGVEAYVDGLYQRNPRREGTQFYHYLVGPMFRFKGPTLQAYNEKWFVHALVGGFTARGGHSPSSSGLSLRVGVGMDVWGVLRMDLNYAMERFSNDTVHLFSWSIFGIVIPFPVSP